MGKYWKIHSLPALLELQSKNSFEAWLGGVDAVGDGLGRVDAVGDGLNGVDAVGDGLDGGFQAVERSCSCYLLNQKSSSSLR